MIFCNNSVLEHDSLFYRVEITSCFPSGQGQVARLNYAGSHLTVTNPYG